MYSLTDIPLSILYKNILPYLEFIELYKKRKICKYMYKNINNYWKNFVSAFPKNYVESCPDHIIMIMILTCKVSFKYDDIIFNDIDI